MRLKCPRCQTFYDHRLDHVCQRSKRVQTAKPTEPPKPIKIEREISYVEVKQKVRTLKADPPPVVEVVLKDITPKRDRNAYMKDFMVKWRKKDKARKAALKGEK